MGFNQVIREHSQMKVVARETAHFDRKKARETMLRLLQTGVQFDAVFAHNDNMILGVPWRRWNPPNTPCAPGY